MDFQTRCMLRKLFFKIFENKKEIKILRQKISELEKYIETNPAESVKKIKDGRIYEPKSFDERTYRTLRRLYYRESNPQHILIFELLTKCGLRISELIDLMIKDINMNFNVDTPRTGKLIIRNGKGLKSREIPLHNDVRTALINWISLRKKMKVDTPYLLISERKKKYTTNGIYRIVKKYHQKLNIEEYSPHSYRHFFCKQLLQNTDISTVARLAGHSSISVTQRYVTASKQDMEDAISKL